MEPQRFNSAAVLYTRQVVPSGAGWEFSNEMEFLSENAFVECKTFPKIVPSFEKSVTGE